MLQYKDKSAFSLVELSIVLVILGLLVGGIIEGKALIRAAQMRAIPTEFNKYLAAANAFRDKYFVLPGDMSTATQFWGRARNTADCVTNSGAAVNATGGTCDGDGDGKIDLPTAAWNPDVSGEDYQFWRQMVLAGLIEGQVSGFAHPSGVNIATPATYIPSKVDSAYWEIMYDSSPYWGALYPSVIYGKNTFYLHVPLNALGGPFMGSAENWSIDKKIDDGNAKTGIVIGSTGDPGTGPCAISATGNYNLPDPRTMCTFAGIAGF